jgi:hypothetical protein
MLTKFGIQNMKELALVDCHLGNEGTKHLAKGQWPNLFSISMGKNILI